MFEIKYNVKKMTDKERSEYISGKFFECIKEINTNDEVYITDKELIENFI